jgi:hypothetical protein
VVARYLLHQSEGRFVVSKHRGLDEILGELVNIRGRYVNMNTGREEDVKEDTTCIMCGFPLSKTVRDKMIAKAKQEITALVGGAAPKDMKEWKSKRSKEALK